MPRAAGIDLGARHVDVVVLTARGPTWSRFPAGEAGAVVDHVGDAAAIAIDAPAELSTAPHESDTAVNRKFRTARCGEIALGEQAGVWVPWVTPADADAVPAWMAVGFDLWAALRRAGREPIEVYPTGAFGVLAGTRLPRKTTAAGRRARLQVLAAYVTLPEPARDWPHDGLDALAAALTARDRTRGTALRCGHDGPACDGSAIWLPAAGERPL